MTSPGVDYERNQLDLAAVHDPRGQSSVLAILAPAPVSAV